jgi:hypothetical protein
MRRRTNQMEGEHTHEIPPVPIVTPIVNTGSELVQPVVDHAAKITEIEGRQSAQEDRLMSQIGEVRSDIARMIEESSTGWQGRVSALEDKLAALLDKSEALTAPPVEAAVETAAEAPEVAVETPAKVVRYIRRGCRRVKREQ